MGLFRALILLWNHDRSLGFSVVCNCNILQNLGPIEGFMNDWLTVTNQVPSVNDTQAHFRLPKDGNWNGAGTDYL